MASFEIHGGQPLKGELIPQGEKNEALQVLCAPLLTSEKVTISNIPDIVDVNKLIALLQAMGVKVEKVEKGTSVVRIEAEMAPLAAYQAYVTAYQQWDDDYVSRTIDEFGDLQTTIADGAPAEPQAPATWVEQSGEITLEWFDDNFV